VIMREEQIGDARLILGDCFAIAPTLGPFETVVSDPPFGMSFRSNCRAERYEAIANDRTEDALIWACNLPVEHSRYVFCRWNNLVSVPKPNSVITWVKNNHSMGNLEHEHGRQTELCLFYACERHYFPTGRPTDVIRAPLTGNQYHPTEKPVQLMRAIIAWTAGVVVDPFMGSGTTLVAATMMGRPSIGIEMNERYFDIACERVYQAQRQGNLFGTAA
jgi:site-specific DNA-methyltransferase (adenine-specific)